MGVVLKNSNSLPRRWEAEAAALITQILAYFGLSEALGQIFYKRSISHHSGHDRDDEKHRETSK